jgi:hypothetical protein
LLDVEKLSSLQYDVEDVYGGIIANYEVHGIRANWRRWIRQCKRMLSSDLD